MRDRRERPQGAFVCVKVAVVWSVRSRVHFRPVEMGLACIVRLRSWRGNEPGWIYLTSSSERSISTSASLNDPAMPLNTCSLQVRRRSLPVLVEERSRRVWLLMESTVFSHSPRAFGSTVFGLRDKMYVWDPDVVCASVLLLATCCAALLDAGVGAANEEIARERKIKSLGIMVRCAKRETSVGMVGWLSKID